MESFWEKIMDGAFIFLILPLTVIIFIAIDSVQALASKKENHSEADCYRKEQIICPTCASVNKPERQDGALVRRTTCEVCGEPFNVEIHETRYTATKIKNESGNPS